MSSAIWIKLFNCAQFNAIDVVFAAWILFSSSKTSVNYARQFYENLVPNCTMYNVDCPDHSFRKFTDDGRYLISFSKNYQDLIVYRPAWLSFSCNREDCDSHDLPSKAKRFDCFFTQLYCIRLASNNEFISKDFFLYVESNQFGIFASQTAQVYDAPATGGAVLGVPSIEKITFHLVRLSDGVVLDEKVYCNDFVNLVHSTGVFLYDDLLAIMSLRYQTIHVLQIRESGYLVDVRAIGPYCREDDELFFYSHAQARPCNLSNISSSIGDGNLSPSEALAFGFPLNGSNGNFVIIPQLITIHEQSFSPNNIAGTAGIRFDHSQEEENLVALTASSGLSTMIIVMNIVTYCYWINHHENKKANLALIPIDALKKAKINKANTRLSLKKKITSSSPLIVDSSLEISQTSPYHMVMQGNGKQVELPLGQGGTGLQRYQSQEASFLSVMKQRLLSFLFRGLWNDERDRTMRAQCLKKKFHFLFQDYVDLIMWKVQFLDRHHLLIKFGSVDGGVSRNTDQQSAFLVVYNIEATEVIAFYQNSAEEIFQLFEQFCDHFHANSRNPAYMNFITSHSNNIHALEQLKSAKSKASSFSQFVKKTMAALPFCCQSQSPSPYFDQSLFRFDEKLISATDGHRQCTEHPIKFISRRHPKILKFKIKPGLEAGGADVQTKKISTFLFHPFLPLALSIQHTLQQPPVVNIHFRR
ncbi:hypothetical protein Sjap_025619 [Stephania japonica]|uniref:Light-mediated development protein DET1 n=1 Tax=Stephania japonica TaxID=461633 RepID=A0AAP0E9T3_9MAGN